MARLKNFDKKGAYAEINRYKPHNKFNPQLYGLLLQGLKKKAVAKSTY
ncbi:MAG TPA: hypothetical protein VMX36_00415 [Sedimentisphaerales bacterium]|nr:hypothetical protein [Sedimentisphaerales bacterium]